MPAYQVAHQGYQPSAVTCSRQTDGGPHQVDVSGRCFQIDTDILPNTEETQRRVVKREIAIPPTVQELPRKLQSYATSSASASASPQTEHHPGLGLRRDLRQRHPGELNSIALIHRRTTRLRLMVDVIGY